MARIIDARAWRPSWQCGSMAGPPRETVTFLFTDIEGSTRLWANEEASMAAAVTRHDDLVRKSIENRGGYVFSVAGDSFGAAFARASDAVAAAIDAQAALAAEQWPPRAPIKARMGLHTGESHERDGSYFGPAVNLAARVMDAGHGGQILATATAVDVSQTKARDLGEHHLRDIDTPVRLVQVGDGVFPPLRVVDPDRIALPPTTTPLVGRDAEVAHVRRLLVDQRLVTLTGVGGCGKTRLALEVAAQEVPARDAGTYFIDLSPVSSPEDLPAAIATGLRLLLGGRGSDFVELLASYLADKNALVVLDNCEHLVDNVAGIVEAVLARGGPVRLVATSRELLGVEGESVVAVRALDDASSIELLRDRAASIGSSFSLDHAQERDAAIELCRRLDGMPLAIELAAARLGVMSVVELLGRLDDRFRLLTGNRRRNRTRTLEATLAWSYDLLGLEERRFFRALGAFPSTFDVRAAAAVARTDEIDALDALDALHAKSLVVAEPAVGGTRYRMLETVRAYAEARLLAEEEAVDARDAHAAHYSALVARPAIFVEPPLASVAAQALEIDNLMTALDWSRSRERWHDVLLLVLAAVEGWATFGTAQPGRAWIRLVLDNYPEADPMYRGILRWSDINLASLSDDWLGAQATALELLAAPEAELTTAAAAQLAFIRWTVGDIAGARADFERARASDVAREATAGLMYVQWVAGSIALGEDDFALARDEFRAGIVSHFTSMCGLNILSVAALDATMGAPAEALSRLEGYDWELIPIGSAEVVRAAALVGLGEIGAARAEVAAFARRASLGRIRRVTNDALVGLAMIAIADDDLAAARSLVLAAGIPRSPHTTALALHVAAQVGIRDEVLAAMNELRRTGQRPDGRDALLAFLSDP
jgi:predicted ATPase/class 3 adenylate cyclase